MFRSKFQLSEEQVSVLLSVNAAACLGMIYTDQQGNVVYVNRRAMRALQYQGKKSPLGQPVNILLGIEPQHTAALLSGQSLCLEVQTNASYLLCKADKTMEDDNNFIGLDIKIFEVNVEHLAALGLAGRSQDFPTSSEAVEDAEEQTNPHCIERNGIFAL